MVTKNERIRQYPEWDKGPYVVYIRKLLVDIKTLQIQNYLIKTYKSAKNIKMINHAKMKVEFNDKSEANLLPKDENLNLYRVYIPNDIVESEGVIYFSQQEDENSLLSESAVGKFKNPAIKSLKILNVFRFTKEKEITDDKGGMSKEAVKTNSLRITFEGKLLPDYVAVGNLLIPVRMYTRKAMFCDKCNTYRHTSKFCCNKPKCIKCGENVHEGECSDIVLCIHCGGEHLAGSKDCPKRFQVQQKEVKRKIINRKKTFADLFYGISNEMPGENPENYLDSPIHFPRLGKRKDPSKAGPSKENEKITPPPRKKKIPNQENQVPPGFIHANKRNENDLILNVLKNLLINLNIPDTWKKLIWELVVPYVHQIITNITASLFSNFGNVNSNA
jgi:hypothetical protein